MHTSGGDRLWNQAFHDLNLRLGHMIHCRVSLADFYLNTKFHSDQKSLLWTDVKYEQTYKHTDTEAGFITSTLSRPENLNNLHARKLLTYAQTKQNKKAQLSLTNPRDAKACQKLLQFDVLTTLSLTNFIRLAVVGCFWNLRNPNKFTENSNL